MPDVLFVATALKPAHKNKNYKYVVTKKRAK